MWFDKYFFWRLDAKMRDTTDEALLARMERLGDYVREVLAAAEQQTARRVPQEPRAWWIIWPFQRELEGVSQRGWECICFRGKLCYLQLELLFLQLSFFAYSPLRPFLDALSHLNRKCFNHVHVQERGFAKFPVLLKQVSLLKPRVRTNSNQLAWPKVLWRGRKRSLRKPEQKARCTGATWGCTGANLVCTGASDFWETLGPLGQKTFCTPARQLSVICAK